MFKMQKALLAFKNLQYGVYRNGIFFASALYKQLTKNIKMSNETKQKLSQCRKGQKWTQQHRINTERYYQKLKENGIKIIPWNKGIPLSQEIKTKMHKTIQKYGNKNLGRKVKLQSIIKEIKTKLTRKFKNISFDDFDFESYIKIPKNAKYKKCDGSLYGKYKRHVMLEEYLLKYISKDKLDEIYKISKLKNNSN